MAKRTISITIDKETEDILNDMSLSTGLSKSFLIRRILKYIDENNLLDEAIIGKKRERSEVKEEKESGFKLRL